MEMEFVEELPSRSATRARKPSQAQLSVAEGLRKNPGVWAKWPYTVKHPQQMSTNIKTGRLMAFPEGEFEACVRSKELYVRYVGE